jgi:tRNA-Thr(GGU) m(6)t(6)A37 methyltransferase TsaA
MDRKMSEKATGDWFSIRPGEVAVELPGAFDAGVYFIGRIRTPWTERGSCPKNSRESDAVCTIDVDPRYAQALTGVETCTHLLVLYWMDKARRDLVIQSPRHYADSRGTFALRSPVRPNPVAASVVRLVAIEGCKLSVVGLDCLDGTPLIDLKPYFPSTDSVTDAVVGWHDAKKG